MVFAVASLRLRHVMTAGSERARRTSHPAARWRGTGGDRGGSRMRQLQKSRPHLAWNSPPLPGGGPADFAARPADNSFRAQPFLRRLGLF